MHTLQSTYTRALIIMAHGTRLPSANEEFFTLVENLGQQASSYGCTRPALLGQAAPTLLQACEQLPEEINQIDIYPLFFNRGRHVDKDIPTQVAEVMAAMPDKDIRLLNYFGSCEGLASLMLEHIEQQG